MQGFVTDPTAGTFWLWEVLLGTPPFALFPQLGLRRRVLTSFPKGPGNVTQPGRFPRDSSG